MLLLKYYGTINKYSMYITQIQLFDMNRHGSTLITAKPKSNKLFNKISYQSRADLASPYRLLFNLRTTSCFFPSLWKYLGSPTKTGSPIGRSTWANIFVKSILWLWKTRIHWKININLTMNHCTTEEYELKGLGDSIFWTCPLSQYSSLNFLIFQSGFLLHLKYYDTGNILWSSIYFHGT